MTATLDQSIFLLLVYKCYLEWDTPTALSSAFKSFSSSPESVEDEEWFKQILALDPLQARKQLMILRHVLLDAMRPQFKTNISSLLRAFACLEQDAILAGNISGQRRASETLASPNHTTQRRSFFPVKNFMMRTNQDDTTIRRDRRLSTSSSGTSIHRYLQSDATQQKGSSTVFDFMYEFLLDLLQHNIDLMNAGDQLPKDIIEFILDRLMRHHHLRDAQTSLDSAASYLEQTLLCVTRQDNICANEAFRWMVKQWQLVYNTLDVEDQATIDYLHYLSYIFFDLDRRPSETIHFLAHLWIRYSQASKSSTRAHIAVLFARLLANLGLERQPASHAKTFSNDHVSRSLPNSDDPALTGVTRWVVSPRWRKLIQDGSDQSAMMNQLLESIESTVSGWLKRERPELTVSCHKLLLILAFLAKSSTSLIVRMNNYFDRLFRFQRFDVNEQRLEMIETMASYWASIQEEDAHDHANVLLAQMKNALVTILTQARKKQPLSQEETQYLLIGYSLPMDLAPTLLLFPLINEVMASNSYTDDTKSFTLRLLSHCKKHLTNQPGSLTCAEALFDIVEHLKDRDLVRDALAVLPYIPTSDDRRRLGHLKFAIGLTKSKYEDVAHQAYESLNDFVAQDPKLCLFPVTSHLVQSIMSMIKSGAVSNLDMTVDMDSIEQSIRMAEQQLNSELSKLNSILELHVTKSQNQSDMVRRSMVNAKWLDLRHEIEALALILLLRVTVSDISFDKKSGDQASDLKNLILRALNWMRHPIYQAYEMDVGSTGLPTLRLSDILFKLLESSEEKIDLFPSFLFPDARWASALTELVENHWSGLSSVLTRAWHQLFVQWNSQHPLVVRSWHVPEASQMSDGSKSMLYTWSMQIHFMLFCSTMTSGDDSSKLISPKESKSLISELLHVLWTWSESISDTEIDRLPLLVRSLLSLLTNPRLDDSVSKWILKAAQESYSAFVTESGRPQSDFPELYATNTYIYLFHSTFCRNKTTDVESSIRRDNDLFQLYWKFFRFWMHRENWPIFLRLPGTTRLQIGSILSNFFRITDGYACQRLYFNHPELEENDILTGQKNYLLDLRSYASRISSMSTLFKVAASDADFLSSETRSELYRIGAELINCAVQCGPLPTTTKGAESQSKIVKSIEKELVFQAANGPSQYTYNAFENFLRWNPSTAETVIERSMVIDTDALGFGDDANIVLWVRRCYVRALTTNVCQAPRKWISRLSRVRLLHLALLYQCSKDSETRVYGMEMVMELLRASSDKPTASEIADTLPSALSLARSNLSEKAYQLGDIMSYVYSEDGENILNHTLKLFPVLGDEDKSHLLHLQAAWVKHMGPLLMEKPDRANPLLPLFLKLSSEALKVPNQRRGVEQIWKSILKELEGQNLESTATVICNFLLTQLIDALIAENQAMADVIRECFGYIVSSRNGSAMVDVMVLKLQQAKSSRRRFSVAPPRNSIDGGRYTDEEFASFTIMLDVAFRSARLLSPHLTTILNAAVVLFDAVPFHAGESLGNQMIWYLVEFLALKNVSSAMELKRIAQWLHEQVPAPITITSCRQQNKPLPVVAPGLIIQELASIFEKISSGLSAAWAVEAKEWAQVSDSESASKAVQVFRYLKGPLDYETMDFYLNSVEFHAEHGHPSTIEVMESIIVADLKRFDQESNFNMDDHFEMGWNVLLLACEPGNQQAMKPAASSEFRLGVRILQLFLQLYGNDSLVSKMVNLQAIVGLEVMEILLKICGCHEEMEKDDVYWVLWKLASKPSQERHYTLLAAILFSILDLASILDHEKFACDTFSKRRCDDLKASMTSIKFVLEGIDLWINFSDRKQPFQTMSSLLGSLESECQKRLGDLCRNDPWDFDALFLVFGSLVTDAEIPICLELLANHSRYHSVLNALHSICMKESQSFSWSDSSLEQVNVLVQSLYVSLSTFENSGFDTAKSLILKLADSSRSPSLALWNGPLTAPVPISNNGPSAKDFAMNKLQQQKLSEINQFLLRKARSYQLGIGLLETAVTNFSEKVPRNQ